MTGSRRHTRVVMTSVSVCSFALTEVPPLDAPSLEECAGGNVEKGNVDGDAARRRSQTAKNSTMACRRIGSSYRGRLCRQQALRVNAWPPPNNSHAQAGDARHAHGVHFVQRQRRRHSPRSDKRNPKLRSERGEVWWAGVRAADVQRRRLPPERQIARSGSATELFVHAVRPKQQPPR